MISNKAIKKAFKLNLTAGETEEEEELPLSPVKEKEVTFSLISTEASRR
jgi:hypothetical protein